MKLLDWERNVVAGAASGLISCIVMSPLDVVKTRLQQQRPGSEDLRGILHAFSSLYRQGGVKIFYRGLAPSLVAIMPNWGVCFPVYLAVRDALEVEWGHGTRAMVAAATASGLVTNFLTAPLWLVRTRLIVQNDGHYEHTRHAFRRIFAEEGLKGFYKGLVPSMIGVAHIMVQMPVYEMSRDWLTAHRGLPDPSHLDPLSIILASSFSKVAGSAVAYPHEVIRTKLQRQRGGLHESVYKGFWHCTRTILEQEGVRGLYRGLGVNLVRVIPYASVTFLVFEEVRKYLEPYVQVVEKK
jgi:solute carrier family 25 folate transporter 32